ncbi:MAG: MFS transporter [Chloroflexota bacterium]|nr:MFS transporter [Chloroflexota bacterium]
MVADPILPHKGLVTVALIGTTALSALDANIVGTAIPSIVGSLHGLGLLPWLLTAFLLTSTISIPLASKLSDRHARKPVLLTGIVLFLLGSALCGLAGSMELLIAFRALQGIGVGCVVPVTLTLIGDLYPTEERARIQGIFSGVWGVAGVAGPAVGGAIVSLWSWPWIFLINVPVGLLAMAILGRYLREPVRPARTLPPLDWAGVGLLSVAVTAALLALSLSKAGGISPPALALLGLAVVTTGTFVWVERRAADPLVPVTVLALPLLRVAVGVGLLADGLIATGGAYLPVLVQGVWQGTPLQAGLALAPLSLGWPLASTFAGRAILRWGYQPVVRTGAAAIVLGTAGLVPLGVGSPVWLLPGTLFVQGLGFGLAYTALLLAIQDAVPWSQRGATTGLYQFARNIGATFSSAALGLLLTAGLGNELARIPNLPSVAGGGPLGPASLLLDLHARVTLPPATRDALIGALAAALHPVLLALAALALGAGLVSLFFPRLTSVLPVSTIGLAEEPTGGVGSPTLTH